MCCVDEGMRRENSEGKCESVDDSIGWILGFIRAAEKVNLFRMKACAKACPCITEYVHPEDPEARSKPGFWRLKELVITISRQSITEEMENINNETDDSGDASHKARTKTNILSKLKRLLPGSSNTVAAIQRDDGSVTGQAAGMAEAMAKH